MFRFVTKKEYWAIDDSGLMAQLPPAEFAWHLKSIQDAMAYKYLYQFNGKIVAEVGGGNSRVLPALARQNSCYNIDPLEGLGGGPETNLLPTEIVNVKALLGKSCQMIKDATFDVLFSISVVEHVPTDDLESFFADNRRIMKGGGCSLHLIDIYTSEEPSPDSIKRSRLASEVFFQYFRPMTDEIIGQNGNWDEALRFHCRYATNPDNIMNTWNKLVLMLRKVREEQQSCTLILAGFAK